MGAANLTAERLREVLHYDPLTGLFRWRVLRKKCPIGKVAGCRVPSPYVVIKVDYARYYAHRLAWLYMTGEWPADQVDHRNRNKADNKWGNLREATQKQNCENQTQRVGTLSGIKGVTWHNRDKLWVAKITHHRKKITLGFSKSLETAAAIRREAEIRLFTHAEVCDTQAESP